MLQCMRNEPELNELLYMLANVSVSGEYAI